MGEPAAGGWKQFILRHHLHDWAAIVAIAIFEVILLKVIPPFRRYVNASMLDDLKFPVKSFTVPIAALVTISFFIPVIFILGYYWYKRDRHDLHHAILGLFFAVLVTSVITDSLKDTTGRPRPDLFWRCFPDGVPHFKPNGDVSCTGKIGDVRQGYKSFPSGHSSWSFAGMTYLAWYFSDRITFTGHRGHVLKHVIVAIPMIGATLVAISIMNDYWHHWSDVVAGGAIGLIVGSYCYRQHFPRGDHHSWFTRPTESELPAGRREANVPRSDIENGSGFEVSVDR